MVILVHEETRLLVQGITGKEGRYHTDLMKKYGTVIEAGVTPGKGGQEIFGIPVYDFVQDAIREHPNINTSIIFVPAKFASDAVIEAINNEIKTIIIITEHIPVHDVLRFVTYAEYNGTFIIGPNTPGVISPDIAKVGIMPGQYFRKGNIGIVSRSGTLTYEVSYSLVKHGLGISTAVGIGGDPITGLSFIEILDMFERDRDTKAVVVIGEIGGMAEEELAIEIEKGRYSKPIIAYIAGRTAPPGKRMGHAGAIIEGYKGTYQSKVDNFRRAGVDVAVKPDEIVILLKKYL
ncbi:MAG: succinate--CoA ligase subunit alpha [Thermoproteales archaeon]|nr:succinate--CoA ligase subunit alpha [Thermoproteales archaeon]